MKEVERLSVPRDLLEIEDLPGLKEYLDWLEIRDLLVQSAPREHRENQDLKARVAKLARKVRRDLESHRRSSGE